MANFLIKRLIGSFLVLIGVSFITFTLLDIVPGDAADVIAGETASQAELDALRAELNLDRPLFERYAIFARQAVFEQDLGKSVFYNRPVSELIRERFGYTLVLALTSIGLALVIGTLIGTLAAWRANSLLDLAVMSLAAFGISLPTFWVALLLIMVFSVHLSWLPVIGKGDLKHIIMPVICLALPTSAVVARLVRSSLLEINQADYVRTAHAKGAQKILVWWRHILRNGLIPVTTVMGLYLGHLMGGAFIVETIFSWPGLGRLAVQSIFNRDFPVVMGSVLLVAVIYQLINLVVDLGQAVLDPRIGQEVLINHG